MNNATGGEAVSSDERDIALAQSIRSMTTSNDQVREILAKDLRWKNIRSLVFLLFLVGPLLAIFVLGKINESKASYVSVVSIEGPILAGRPASATNIIPRLEQVFKDESSKGVIVKVNSPGGSPVQSALIKDALLRLRDEYPDTKVLVAAEDMITSGAYMIALGAEEIYANKSTVVGSIGSVSQSFDFTDLMENIGVKQRTNTSGDMKSSLSPFAKAMPYQLKRLDAILLGIHENFMSDVLTSRPGVKESDMTGDFWLAQEALDKGFVDGISDVYLLAQKLGAEDIRYYRSLGDLIPRGAAVAAQILSQSVIDALSYVNIR